MSTRTRARIYDTLPGPGLFGDVGVDARAGLAPVGACTQRRVADFVASPDFDGWSQAVARLGNCVKPIKLAGSSQTIDTTTGEVVGAYSSRDEPLGVTWVRCADRAAD